MKRILLTTTIGFTVLFTSLAQAAPAIIPAPARLEARDGVFMLADRTRICTDKPSYDSAEYLAVKLRASTGRPLKLSSGKAAAGDILITTDGADAALGEEGYTLSVSPKGAVIRALQPAGAFYGVQSLLQLLPPQALSKTRADGMEWALPAVEIRDLPRFKWRGVMLDCGRHFFPAADVKRMIDLAAFHKLNTFHWHLTDDQGWRIEIKKHPKLTEVGAWRDSSPPYGNRDSDDGKRHGGFYTQAEVKDIVAYAAARHITVVPEIEMPGHAAAAIAAYPELGNSDIPGYAPRVMTRWGVHPYIFAPKEETFKFLDDVLTEVCELFPSKIIHIGGDEAPKTQWQKSAFAQSVIKREGLKDEHELQSWFVRRIEKILAAKGRRLIGWDEIQEGGLPKTATMMVWRDAGWAKHALSQGNDVVMATTSHTYLDYYQAPATTELANGKEFESIGGFLPLAKVYSYNPAFVAQNAAQEKQILGTQGQLWAEYIKDIRKAQYLALPRLAAIAEVAWSPQDGRDFEDFQRRLETQYERYDALGFPYHRDTTVKIGEWSPTQISTDAKTLEWDVTRRVKSAGELRVMFNYTMGKHGLDIKWVALLEDGREVARDTHDGFTGHNPSNPAYTVNLPAYKSGARYTLRAQVGGSGGSDSAGTVNLQVEPRK